MPMSFDYFAPLFAHCYYVLLVHPKRVLVAGFIFFSDGYIEYSVYAV